MYNKTRFMFSQEGKQFKQNKYIENDKFDKVTALSL